MPRNGFTLVELMVAITVMALLTSAVVLTARSGGDQPRAAATRLAARLAAARDQAILTGAPIAATIDASGVAFDQRRSGRWLAVAERPLQPFAWPSDVKAAKVERVQFDPLGLAQESSEIRLESEGRTAAISVSAAGEVQVR